MMSGLQQMSNTYSLTGRKAHKYTTEQLTHIENLFAKFNVHELFASKSPEVEHDCLRFLGENLVIPMTSASMMYNLRQKHANRMLTFDLRSRAKYHQAHLVDSVSFPIDLCDERFFIDWNAEYIEREIIKNKEKLALFKTRKRLFICVIAGSEEVQDLLQVLPMIFKSEHLERFE